MPIETPLAPVFQTCDKRQPVVSDRAHLGKDVSIGTTDVQYHLYTDSSTHGWGTNVQELIVSDRDHGSNTNTSYTSMPMFQAIWMCLQAFKQIE